METMKPQLTKRELQVLKLICKQYTNPEIAETLDLGVRTIDGFRESLLKKTKSRNVVGLVLYAIKQGIVKV
jgi:DNA-binding CsgD family transcriptional regulator